MADGMVRMMFGAWNQWMALSARTPTTVAPRKEPAVCEKPSCRTMMLRSRTVMMPPTATTGSSRRGMLKMMEKPIAEIAAAMACEK